MPVRSILLLAALTLAGCAPTSISVPDTSEVPVGPMTVSAANENLHAVLWTQTAAEFRALTIQTYAVAEMALARALADPSWTADVAQLAAGGYESLPPAVVLDVDETVLDNSAYQARLVQTNGEYDRESWKAWVEEAAATPVPGALDFIRAADSMGVVVVYLTNRRADEEDATRANLAALGFPIAAKFDAVLTRGEAGEGSDKAARRAVVTEQFRVLAYFGDNLGDFISYEVDSIEARNAVAAPYESWWGERWFVFPNPQYGGWESVTFGGDYSLSREERLRRKAAALRVD